MNADRAIGSSAAQAGNSEQRRLTRRRLERLNAEVPVHLRARKQAGPKSAARLAIGLAFTAIRRKLDMATAETWWFQHYDPLMQSAARSNHFDMLGRLRAEYDAGMAAIERVRRRRMIDSAYRTQARRDARQLAIVCLNAERDFERAKTRHTEPERAPAHRKVWLRDDGPKDSPLRAKSLAMVGWAS